MTLDKNSLPPIIFILGTDFLHCICKVNHHYLPNHSNNFAYENNDR